LSDMSTLWRIYCDSGRTDLETRNTLFQHYLYLIPHAVARCRMAAMVDPAVTQDDLEGYASIGLLWALERYDLEHNTPFEYYAPSVIRGAIWEHVRRCYSLGGRHATERTASPVSLDAIGDDCGEELCDLADTTVDPQVLIEEQESREALRRAIVQLQPTEQAVVQMYFQDRLTVSDIASALHVSRGRTSQILHQAVQRLRAMLKRGNFVTTV